MTRMTRMKKSQILYNRRGEWYSPKLQIHVNRANTIRPYAYVALKTIKKTEKINRMILSFRALFSRKQRKI